APRASASTVFRTAPDPRVNVSDASSTPVVAIDGPSGSGKGAVSERLATRLGWHYLDSGALYRAVGMAARRAGVDLDDAGAVAPLAAALDIEFRPKPDASVVVLLDK